MPIKKAATKPRQRKTKVSTVKKDIPPKTQKVKEEVKPVKKRDYLFTVGKRKTSVARVRLYPKKNEGKIIVNNKDFKEYFPYFEYQKTILTPLELLGLKDKYDITIKVKGGGIRGQADSIRHGISRVLLKLDEDSRKTLRGAGLLTRDARKKERKKPGLKGARRAPQWAKR